MSRGPGDHRNRCIVVRVLFLRTLWYITMVRTMKQDGDEGLEARQKESDELDEAKSNASMLQTATGEAGVSC